MVVVEGCLDVEFTPTPSLCVRYAQRSPPSSFGPQSTRLRCKDLRGVLVGSESSLRFRRPIIFGTILVALFCIFVLFFIGENLCLLLFCSAIAAVGSFHVTWFFVVVC
jgi:hypothetical protein